MVVPLSRVGPVKFYGSSLPRPRIYTDLKFNDERVDPPTAVTDPFMSWAHEAHWSMGGLNTKRTRLQGRIEGSVIKLRRQRERKEKAGKSADLLSDKSDSDESDRKSSRSREKSVSPPPAPVAVKRKRYMALIDDDEEDENEVVNAMKRKGLVKKLGDDFDRVASESEGSSPLKLSRSWRSEENSNSSIGTAVMKVVEKANPKKEKSKGGGKGKNEMNESPKSVSGIRSSPRLAKR